MSARTKSLLGLLAWALILAAALAVSRVPDTVHDLAAAAERSTRPQEPTSAPQEQRGRFRDRKGPRAGLGAPTALSRLRVAEPTNAETYDRDAFGYDWADLDRDGCNTREEVLAAAMTRVVLADDDCNVERGTLADPYTGRTIRFVEDANALAVQIDHLYPLSLAWQHGADEWSDAKRLTFANDTANLIAADGPTNASKGDSGPGEWMPPAEGYACTYARRYVAVAYAYRLTIASADRAVLADALSTC